MLYMKVVKRVNLRVLIIKEKIIFIFTMLYLHDMMDIH